MLKLGEENIHFLKQLLLALAWVWVEVIFIISYAPPRRTPHPFKTLQPLAISTDTSILHKIVTLAGYTSLAVLCCLHVHVEGYHMICNMVHVTLFTS